MLNSDLGVAVEEQNGQRTGDAPEPPMGQQADDNKGCGDFGIMVAISNGATRRKGQFNLQGTATVTYAKPENFQ